jgi:hypothetical protein
MNPRLAAVQGVKAMRAHNHDDFSPANANEKKLEAYYEAKRMGPFVTNEDMRVSVTNNQVALVPAILTPTPTAQLSKSKSNWEALAEKIESGEKQADPDRSNGSESSRKKRKQKKRKKEKKKKRSKKAKRRKKHRSRHHEGDSSSSDSSSSSSSGSGGDDSSDETKTDRGSVEGRFKMHVVEELQNAKAVHQAKQILQKHFSPSHNQQKALRAAVLADWLETAGLGDYSSQQCYLMGEEEHSTCLLHLAEYLFELR